MKDWGWRLAMLAAAGVAGYVAKSMGLPLPWMIGPLLLTACLGLAEIEIPRHQYYRPVGQLVVATAVGLYFTPDALAEVSRQAVEMVAAAILTIGAGFTSALLLYRLARTDGSTAFFAAMPGGPAEMSVLAERWGVPGAPVVFSQTLRIVFIVLLIPPLLMYFAGISIPRLRPVAEVNLPGLVALYALAAAGTVVMRAVRVPNCNFLGPLAVGALISGTGFVLSGVPAPLLAAGQVLLGVSLGAQFTRQQIARDIRFSWAAVIATIALLAQCAAVAYGLWLITDGKLLGGFLLATAPGSVTEMALTAKLLSQGVAMVTAYHLVRIFIVIPLAPLLYRIYRYTMRGWMVFPDGDAPGSKKNV
ncbi:MAG: AbrB family transcriptional regulator [Hyphomicrobiaceae bacterium]|nr:AbrB family transcriptional regulator [Hyphomicrobiaceae bacterium]